MRVIANEERDYIAGRLLTEIWELTADEWRERRALIRYHPHHDHFDNEG